MIDFSADLHVWGTPRQYPKIADLHAKVRNAGFKFGCASMPNEGAERNSRLFAEKVMPGVEKLSANVEIGTSPLENFRGRLVPA